MINDYGLMKSIFYIDMKDKKKSLYIVNSALLIYITVVYNSFVIAYKIGWIKPLNISLNGFYIYTKDFKTAFVGLLLVLDKFSFKSYKLLLQ